LFTDGSVLNTSRVAAPGLTLTLALLATAAPDTCAPSVTAPAFIPVKLARYTPDPRADTTPKLPVPPTALEVNAINPASGAPAGSAFPYASFNVRVAVIIAPETTLPLDTATPLFDTAYSPGATLIAPEHAPRSPDEVAFRYTVPERLTDNPLNPAKPATADVLAVPYKASDPSGAFVIPLVQPLSEYNAKLTLAVESVTTFPSTS
jgi:hypothetical protein